MIQKFNQWLRERFKRADERRGGSGGRRGVEAALRQREAELARVQRIGEVGGVEVDVLENLRGRRSPEYLRLHGLPPDTTSESHEDWLRRVHPDDRAQADRTLREALAGEVTVYENEYRIIRPDNGSVRWILAKADIERDADGRALRLVGAHIDITQRKELELALRASEARQAFLLTLSDALRPLADTLEIQTTASRVLGEHLGVNRAFYSEIEDDDYLFVGHFERGAPPMPPGRYAVNEFGEAVIRDFRAGQPVRVSDTETDPRFTPPQRAAYAAISVRAFAAVPLVKDGRLSAILTVNSITPRDWTPEELERVDETAQRTWAAVERAKSELSLHVMEERYLALFNSIDQGFCTIEVKFDEQEKAVDYRFLEVSPSFERQTGIRDATGRWMRDIACDQEDHWFEIYGRVAQTGEPARFENFSSPLQRWWSVYAFRIQAPELHRIGVLFNDITERKRNEERRLEEERRFRLFIEQVQDYAIFTMDTQARPTSWNEGVRRVLGFEEAEFIGQDITSIIFTPEDIEAGIPQREMQEAIQTGRAGNDRWLRKKDGTRFFAFGTTTAQYNASGELSGFTKITRDQTDRKRLEEDLARAAAELSQMNQRKDEFLAMLSHELRNPLAPIRSAVQILRMRNRDPKDPIQQQAHEIIERQVANLTKLVGDLLEVSRVLSGRIRLNLQTVDLNQIAAHALETARPVIDQHGHTLTLHAGGRPLWCRADAGRMEEVFINLLNNAAKYTHDHGRIEVWCEPAPEGQAVQFRVRDNGVGIEPELMPRIFDLFTQADRSLARSGGGLGIGLSLAHRIVALHGATIEAHSPPAEDLDGSEFIVRIARAAPPAQEQPAGPAPSAQVNPAAPAELRVLVVDDNLDQLTMLAAALRERGYPVQTAQTGPDALERARAWGPQVVLLDIGLPGMDGYQVARRLRADPELPVRRLIALTGYGRESDIAQARQAGFDAHLTKPCAFDELERCIHAAHGS